MRYSSALDPVKRAHLFSQIAAEFPIFGNLFENAYPVAATFYGMYKKTGNAQHLRLASIIANLALYGIERDQYIREKLNSRPPRRISARRVIEAVRAECEAASSDAD